MDDMSDNFSSNPADSFFDGMNDFAPIYSPMKTSAVCSTPFAPFEDVELSSIEPPCNEASNTSDGVEEPQTAQVVVSAPPPQPLTSSVCTLISAPFAVLPSMPPIVNDTFFLCVNCGKWCSNPDEMRDHKLAAKHLGFLKADASDNFECFVCKTICLTIHKVLDHILKTQHDQFQKIRVSDVQPPPVSTTVTAPVPRDAKSLPVGPFRCTNCLGTFPNVKDITSHTGLTGHTQFSSLARSSSPVATASKAIPKPVSFGAKRKTTITTGHNDAAVQKIRLQSSFLGRPIVPTTSIVAVTQEHNTNLSVCLQCTRWCAGTADELNHTRVSGHSDFLPVKHKGTRTSYKCMSCSELYTTPQQVANHMSRNQHYNFATLYVDGEKFRCVSCLSGFVTESDAQAHTLRFGHERFIHTSTGKSLTDQPKGYAVEAAVDVYSSKKTVIPYLRVELITSISPHLVVLIVSTAEELKQAQAAVKSLDEGMSSGLGLPHDIFLCCVCGLRFECEVTLDLHVKQQHLTQDGVCTRRIAYLRVETGVLNEVQQKELGHGISACFHCLICKKEVSSPRKLLKHLKSNHTKKCPLCSVDVVMLDALSMKKHLKTSGCLTRCSDCGKRFSDSFDLRLHKNKGKCPGKPTNSNIRITIGMNDANSDGYGGTDFGDQDSRPDKSKRSGTFKTSAFI